MSCPEASSRRCPGCPATHLYLIAPEAVHNAVKHAQAREVRVSLTADGGLVLDVRDAGPAGGAPGPGPAHHAQPRRGPRRQVEHRAGPAQRHPRDLRSGADDRRRGSWFCMSLGSNQIRRGVAEGVPARRSVEPQGGEEPAGGVAEEGVGHVEQPLPAAVRDRHGQRAGVGEQPAPRPLGPRVVPAAPRSA